MLQARGGLPPAKAPTEPEAPLQIPICDASRIAACHTAKIQPSHRRPARSAPLRTATKKRTRPCLKPETGFANRLWRPALFAQKKRGRRYADPGRFSWGAGSRPGAGGQRSVRLARAQGLQERAAVMLRLAGFHASAVYGGYPDEPTTVEPAHGVLAATRSAAPWRRRPERGPWEPNHGGPARAVGAIPVMGQVQGRPGSQAPNESGMEQGAGALRLSRPGSAYGVRLANPAG